jgi:hypothetical protein
MFKLIGTNSSVEVWDQEYEVPILLQNELLRLDDGHCMYALGDPQLGWGFLVLESTARNAQADSVILKDLEQKYFDVKKVSPTSRNRPSTTSVTQH